MKARTLSAESAALLAQVLNLWPAMTQSERMLIAHFVTMAKWRPTKKTVSAFSAS